MSRASRCAAGCIARRGCTGFLGTLNIGAVRVSPGLMNTAAEAGKLIDAVWKIAKAR